MLARLWLTPTARPTDQARRVTIAFLKSDRPKGAGSDERIGDVGVARRRLAPTTALPRSRSRAWASTHLGSESEGVMSSTWPASRSSSPRT